MSAPTLDLVKQQTPQKPYKHMGPQFAASVVLLNTPDIPVNAQAAVAALRSDEHNPNPLQGETLWAASSAWRSLSNGDRPELAPRLRLELQGGKLEVTPRRHSIWFEWRTPLP